MRHNLNMGVLLVEGMYQMAEEGQADGRKRNNTSFNG
jgi:hypothetical protein